LLAFLISTFSVCQTVYEHSAHKLGLSECQALTCDVFAQILHESSLTEAAPGAAIPNPALPPPPPPRQMLASVAPLAPPLPVTKPAASLARPQLGLRRMSGSYQQSLAAAESSRKKQQIYAVCH